MNKRIKDFQRILGLLLCFCAAVILTGPTKVWADEDQPGKHVVVSSSKELKKAIDDPDIEFIHLVTSKFMNLTIKANENAKNKYLIIDAEHTNITNKAKFNLIDISAVCDYVENVSGNDIAIYDLSNCHSFTVAKNKTVKCLSLFSNHDFNNTFNNYVLRKGAKLEELTLCYNASSDGSLIESTYNENNREASIKYTDSLGEDRSYTVSLDKDGRISRMVSDKTFKYDYTFSYDVNGNLIGVIGYDDDDGNLSITYTFKDNLEQKSVLNSDNRKEENSFSFDENGRTVTIKTINTSKDEESVTFYTYNYDEKGRLIYEYVDYGKDSNKLAYYYTYNSKSFLTKIAGTCYTPDGQQYGDSQITTYKFNKAGSMIKKVFTCGDYKETTKYFYDDLGFFTEKKVTTDEGSRRVEIPMTLEEFKDLNHLLFVENQQEKMFERHTSQSVTYYNDFPLSVDKAYVYYVTPDSVYSEAADWEDYGKDRLCYQILGTSDPENSYMHYIADLTEDWKSNMWRYLPTDESKWMDYERDQFIGAYKEDGKIHLLTRYNEDLSREYAEETIGVKYEGETYITESIFDAKNYDYLEMIVTKELNDNSEVVCRIVFEYDTPEPAACRTLRCAFETAAANMVNVTFVVDPGTKNEISKKFMVPANTNVSYNIDDLENVEVFTDRKCETPVTEKWDKMSDITMYFKHVDTANKAE